MQWAQLVGTRPAIGKHVSRTTYDGTGSLEAFLTQFGCVSALNGWGEGESMLHLVTVLGNPAAEVLTAMPRGLTSSQGLVLAPRRWCGAEHQMKLVRAQLANLYQ